MDIWERREGKKKKGKKGKGDGKGRRRSNKEEVVQKGERYGWREKDKNVHNIFLTSKEMVRRTFFLTFDEIIMLDLFNLTKKNGKKCWCKIGIFVVFRFRCLLLFVVHCCSSSLLFLFPQKRFW